MCCCSVGIIIMKHALCLCSSHPLSLFLPSPLLCSSFCPLPNISTTFPCLSLILVSITSNHPFLIRFVFLPPFPPCRGAGVLGAVSVLGQRATRPGEGTLRAGFRPGCRPPVCPPLRPSPRTHPAPAPPGRARPRDAKVHKPNPHPHPSSPAARRQSGL